MHPWGPDNRQPSRGLFDLDRHYWFIAAAVLALILVLGFVYREALGALWRAAYQFLADKERVAAAIQSFGVFAPLVFIAFQFLQVIFAPIPGEATGFIGGYIFGAGKGFLFSTIGLTLGSLANFLIGRYLGRHVIRRFIPEKTLARFNRFLRHQGVIIVFFLFVLPGFPKDYLCLFLGIGNLSTKLFALISTIGRMPGTLILSLQGALLFERDYLWLSVLVVFCLLLLVPAYRYREALYRWAEKFNHGPDKTSG
ncbi:MAG: TVP38/TMEM64 family protein [Desulfobacterales bacterium]